jgi:hypothetical protein
MACAGALGEIRTPDPRNRNPMLEFDRNSITIDARTGLLESS